MSETSPKENAAEFVVELNDRDNVPDELLEVFTEEAEDHIQCMYDTITKLESAPSDSDAIQSIRRAAHTLKGAAGAVGLQVSTQLAHRMEDLLDLLYDTNSTVHDECRTLLYQTTDALQDLVSGDFDKESMQASIAELYIGYSAMLEEFRNAEATTEPAASEESSIDNAISESEPEIQETVEAVESTKPQQSRGNQQHLRVPVERLDGLVRTAGELLINRSSFETRMIDFKQFLSELQITIERLQSISTELDSRYSVNALGGRHAFSDGAGLIQNALQVSQSRFSEFDSLEFDRYTDFHLLSRSLSETTSDINTVGNELRHLMADFDTLLTRQGRLSRDVQNRLMKVRMVPLSSIASRLDRAVRVAANQLGKQIDLDIRGDHVELDKFVLEEVADPLQHLLRNAVDHGIEDEELRALQDKSEVGNIFIDAYYDGTQVVIKVQDDGAGLNSDAIRERAVRNNLLSEEEAISIQDAELVRFLFVPGFSTAQSVSEISGRGVGMDIVRQKVESLKGTIDVDSVEGEGTTFTIRLPMTLAVTRALLVSADHKTFAVPIQSIRNIIRAEDQILEKVDDQWMVEVGEDSYQIVSLAERLGLPCPGDSFEHTPLLILNAGDEEVAVAVDRIVSGRDIVVKPLGNHLKRVEGLIGATILGDGTVIPILDAAGILNPTKQVSVPAIDLLENSQPETPTVMIVDDSVSVRRVTGNLIKNAGWLTLEAKDGVDALETLEGVPTKPQVFLLDIEMPRMDGYELLASLRSQPEYHDKPIIIIITSRANEKHRNKAIELGATDYLIKPFQEDQLLTLIRKVLEPVEQNTKEAVCC